MPPVVDTKEEKLHRSLEKRRQPILGFGMRVEPSESDRDLVPVPLQASVARPSDKERIELLVERHAN